MAVSHPARRPARGEVDPGLIGQGRDHRVQQRDVDLLPPSRRFPLVERRQDPLDRVHPGRDVGDRDPHLRGRAVGRAGHAHDAALPLDDDVVPRLGAARPGVAVAGDRAVDQARQARVQMLEAEPQAVERARPEVLDQDVGARQEALEQRAAARLLEIERDAEFGAVDGQEVAAFSLDKRRPPDARVVPLAGILDLDHLGAEIGQRHRGVGPREYPRQVQDPHPFERRSHALSCQRGTNRLLDTYSPAPGRPITRPSRAISRPRWITTHGLPRTRIPS